MLHASRDDKGFFPQIPAPQRSPHGSGEDGQADGQASYYSLHWKNNLPGCLPAPGQSLNGVDLFCIRMADFLNVIVKIFADHSGIGKTDSCDSKAVDHLGKSGLFAFSKACHQVVKGLLSESLPSLRSDPYIFRFQKYLPDCG